jgi:hypothetical protein
LEQLPVKEQEVPVQNGFPFFIGSVAMVFLQLFNVAV